MNNRVALLFGCLATLSILVSTPAHEWMQQASQKPCVTMYEDQGQHGYVPKVHDAMVLMRIHPVINGQDNQQGKAYPLRYAHAEMLPSAHGGQGTAPRWTAGWTHKRTDDSTRFTSRK